jgi:hypothetical protein
LYCSTYITITCGRGANQEIDNFFVDGQEVIDLSENRQGHVTPGFRISFLHQYHYSFIIAAIFWAFLMFASLPLAYSVGSTYLFLFPGIF